MAHNMTDPAAFYDHLTNATAGGYQSVNKEIGMDGGDAEVIAHKTADCLLFKFLLYTVSMGLLCIMGSIGNTVSFLVLRRDCSTPVASFLLQALAIADNVFLLLWMTHYSLRELIRFVDPDALNHAVWLYLRVYSFPVLYMAQTQTIWLTVIIAINRFMAVCLPYKAPHLCTVNNVYKECLLVTIFSFLYNLPRFFEISLTWTTKIVQSTNSSLSEESQQTLDWSRTTLGNSTTYNTVYTDGMYYLFSFVFPLLILGFVNARVTIAYRAARKRRRRMTSRRADNENNITLVMIIVVLVFMCCQAPARIVQLAWSYKYTHCKEFQYYLIHISNTFEVLNSSVNFAVYFVFRRRFRSIFWSSICIPPFVSPPSGRTGLGGAGVDSQRLTTTEGLSLAQFEQSTMVDPLGGSFATQPAANIPPSLVDHHGRSRSHSGSDYRQLRTADANHNGEINNIDGSVTMLTPSHNGKLKTHDNNQFIDDTTVTLHEHEVKDCT